MPAHGGTTVGKVSSKRSVARAVIALALFCLAAADLTAKSRTAQLHVDEPNMINRGFLAPQLYAHYLRTGSLLPGWNGWIWQPRKAPLGKVIVGAALWLGNAAPPAAPYSYDWWHDYRWNAARGRLPDPAVLTAGRQLVPLFAAAATVAVFLLAAGVGGLLGGLAAAALFYYHPVSRLYGPRALADMPMMAFSLWAVWYLARRVAPAW
jgi:hypothetical protein